MCIRDRSGTRRARRKVRRLYDIPVATTTKQLLSSQQLDYRYCRRSSYADTKDETATTPLDDHRTVPPALSRSPPFPEPRNASHKRQDAAPIGNTTLPRTDVFTSFIRPSHEKKTCAHTDNLNSTARWPDNAPQTTTVRLADRGQSDVIGPRPHGTCMRPVMRYQTATTFLAQGFKKRKILAENGNI